MSYINAMITSGLAFAIPLFIMAVGGIYSEKSGITNLAVEGFQGFGAFCGAVVAVFLGMNTGLSSSSIIYVAMLFSFIGGAIYAIIHALLCIKFRADQVISGVVINILGVALTTFLTTTINTALFGNASNKFTLGVSPRFSVPGISKIPVIGAIFTNIYPFEIIILIIAVYAWYLMYKTKFGMRLRACGENPQAVDAAGGDVAKTRFISVMISGGLSGIGGICFAYSLLSQFSPSIYLGYGYLAIAAMIFGNWNIIYDLRQLEHHSYLLRLHLLRHREGGRLPALPGYGTCVDLFGSVPDDSVYPDSAASDVLLEEESSAEGGRRGL